MSIRINGDNTTAAPGITSGADTDTGLQFGTDEIQLVTGGTNRATVESNGNFTIEDGNLVVAAGHGIDFSATANSSGTMSSELLDDYEEGVWTPNAYPSGGTINSFHGQSGRYVKIGRIVHARFAVHINVASTAPTSVGAYLYVAGLPFVSNNTFVNTGQAREQSVVGFMYNVNLAANASTFVLHRVDNSGVIGDGYNYHGSLIYEVD